jgi:hypothetical protein
MWEAVHAVNKQLVESQTEAISQHRGYTWQRRLLICLGKGTDGFNITVRSGLWGGLRSGESTNGLAVMVVSMKVLVPWARFRYPPRCSSSGSMRAVTYRHRHRHVFQAAQAGDPVARVCHLCHYGRYHHSRYRLR